MTTQPANNDFLEEAKGLFSNYFQVDFEQILEPISETQPSGEYLRANGVYSTIREARREEQELSQGVWQRDLKHADWEAVSRCALNAIHYKTKDLQVGLWLLEAEIHQRGFTAIAPCMALLDQMCRRYWNSLHPQIVEDDLDYRFNPLIWANEKLGPSLKLVPLTAMPQLERQYCWADWELAQRNEHAKEQHSKLEQGDILPSQFIQAWAGSPSAHCRGIYQDIAKAVEAIEHFSETLDELCASSDAPGMGLLTRLLAEIQATLEYLSAQKGLSLNLASTTGSASTVTEKQTGTQGQAGGGDGGGNHDADITSRETAYAMLARAADYLVQIEPHSPAPYLVKKAIEWGHLSTPELYRELFVQYQGQLNIFDLLGLELGDK